MIVVTGYCGTSSIVEALRRNGHNVLIGTHHLQELNVDAMTGLVLSGGEDINPRYYNEKPTHTRYWNEVRDKYELDLLDRALGSRVPVLGICRGHQLLNVFLGGSLYQDIYEAGFHHLGVHNVTMTSIGQTIFKREVVYTNSMHHQAVKELGGGTDVVGVHPDGTVESIYNAGLHWLGVQWHPEFQEYEDTFHDIVGFLFGRNN